MNTTEINKVLTITEEVVKEHAPLILKELGLDKDNDGILERISVTSKVGEDVPQGYCKVRIIRRNLLGEPVYIQGTAAIDLNPLAFLVRINNKGRMKMMPKFIRSFLINGMERYLRRLMTFVLAHELRHYQQYYTGLYFEKEAHFGGASLMPYSMRWCEKDANEFAKQYVKGAFKR